MGASLEVGLTEEMDRFWEMLAKRVAYMRGAPALAAKQAQVHKASVTIAWEPV